MKLFRQRSLLFAGLPRPRLHKTSSYADVLDTYHSSNSATDVSVFSPHVDETGFLRPSRRQVVSFCEEDNESYTSPWLITTDRDCPSRSNDNPQTQQQQQQQQQQQPDGMTILVSQKSVWYTNDDIAKFKHEQEVYGRLIVNREKLSIDYYRNDKRHKLWSNAVSQAYQGLYRATSVHEMNDIMAGANTFKIEPMALGLEKWSLPELRKIRSSQRTALIKAVVSRQYRDSPRQLRRLSRRMSRPSRLFAIYLGKATQEV